MDNKNLPATSITHAPVSPRNLQVGIGFLAIGTVGLIFTSSWIVSGLALLVGMALVVSYGLIKKSVAATSEGSFKDYPFTEFIKKHKHEIAQTKYMKNNADLGERAFSQISQLQERYQYLHTLLRQKFVPTELAFSRYTGALDESAMTLLENFKLLSHTLRSLDTMDAGHLSEERKAHLEQEKKNVQEILGHNERALKQLDDLSSSVQLVGAGGSTNSSLEDSLEQLKRLTEQAKKYSR